MFRRVERSPRILNQLPIRQIDEIDTAEFGAVGPFERLNDDEHDHRACRGRHLEGEQPRRARRRLSAIV